MGQTLSTEDLEQLEKERRRRIEQLQNVTQCELLRFSSLVDYSPKPSWEQL